MTGKEWKQRKNEGQSEKMKERERARDESEECGEGARAIKVLQQSWVCLGQSWAWRMPMSTFPGRAAICRLEAMVAGARVSWGLRARAEGPD
jgi:hypothetical protein